MEHLHRQELYMYDAHGERIEKGGQRTCRCYKRVKSEKNSVSILYLIVSTCLMQSTHGPFREKTCSVFGASDHAKLNLVCSATETIPSRHTTLTQH